MIFEKRSDFEGKHAILSPSQCGWFKNFNEEAILNRVRSYYAAQIGTIIHDLARELIDKRIKINKHDKKLALLRLLEKDIPRAVIDIDNWYDAFMTFVNDAIALDMSPEVQLIFSPVAFGTSDAVSFDGELLRIHDLKTGSIDGKMDQLLIYAAYFCLHYKIKPKDISVELRIYQRGNVVILDPTAEELEEAMDICIKCNKLVSGFLS